LTFFPPTLAGVDALCLILDIISNMAGVGLLNDAVSDAWCWGAVSSGISGNDAVNFCFTLFD
jgi:hypothetical protein